MSQDHGKYKYFNKHERYWRWDGIMLRNKKIEFDQGLYTLERDVFHEFVSLES